MIQTIKQLYFRYKELINYVIVGGLTTVVSLASYYFFTTAFLDSLSGSARPISTDGCQYVLMDLRSFFCLYHKPKVRF